MSDPRAVAPVARVEPEGSDLQRSPATGIQRLGIGFELTPGIHTGAT